MSDEKREKFKVKIIKSTFSTSWYAEKINLEYTVLESTHEDEFYVTLNGDYIKKEDCEVLRSPVFNAYRKTPEDERQKNPSITSVLEGLNVMLKIKDERYGNSALKPLDIFAKHHYYGARLDEKLARVKNSDELRKNDVADLIGGLVLICKDKKWDNFTDLID